MYLYSAGRVGLAVASDESGIKASRSCNSGIVDRAIIDRRLIQIHSKFRSPYG
jgi:hypothetical protein